MASKLSNLFAQNIIKRQASGGSIRIVESIDENEENKRLVIMVEIEASDKDNETIINLLVEELERQFFNAPTQTLEYAFENALSKANVKVKDILLSKPRNWLNKIHAAVLAIDGEEIHMASVGQMHAFLIHQDKVADVLNDSSSPGPALSSARGSLNPVKLFSAIVSGQLTEGNSIVVTNESVLDYLSNERIRKSAKEFSPIETVARLSELLEKAPPIKQFSILAIKRMRAPKEASEAGDQVEQAQITKEEIVEQYLRPEQEQEFEQGGTDFKKYAENFLKILIKLLQKGISVILAFISLGLEKLQIFFKRLIPKIAKIPEIVLALWKNRSARDYHWSKVKEKMGNKITNSQTKISTMPRKKKLVIGATALLVAVFMVGITIRAQEKKTEITETAHSESVNSIEQKISEAEAALIYENKDRAKQVLGEAHSLIDDIEKKLPQNSEEYEKLRQRIIELQNKSEKKVVLRGISPIVTIIPPPLSKSASQLLLAGGEEFYVDGVGQRIARVDTQKKLLINLPFDSNTLESFNTAVALGNDALVAIATNTVLLIDIKNETIDKERFEFNPAASLPFTSYGRNLYTISLEKNDIIRYQKATRGFTPAQNWLVEDYDMSNMVDIAIDGFVYTLANNGDIHVFLRGRFNKVIPWPVEDKPRENIKFFTTENGDYFYILDPQNQRIVRETKAGELVQQLIAPEFEKATNLIINEKESNILVLAEDKIYQIPIEP